MAEDELALVVVSLHDGRSHGPYWNSSKHCSGDYCVFYKPVVLNVECLSNLTEEKVVCNSDSKFVYKEFEMKKTVISEFNLVCDKTLDLCRPVAESLFMVGLMVGSLVFGPLSDKFGRRNIILAEIFTAFRGNLVGAFLPDCWSYGVSRLVVGAGALGAYMEGEGDAGQPLVEQFTCLSKEGKGVIPPSQRCPAVQCHSQCPERHDSWEP